MRSLALLCIATSLLAMASARLRAQETEDPLTAAIAALNAGDLETAEAGFLEAVRIDPTREQAWLGLSAFQAADGKILEALHSARNADELAPDQAVTLLTIGRLQATLGAYDAAFVTLDRARELHPDNSDIWLLSALLLRDLGRSADAIERLELARAQGIDRPEVIEELGLLLLDQDRSAEALALARSALEADPERPQLHRIIGLALARDENGRAEAISHLERSLAAGGGASDRVRLELSTLLADAGRADEALAHLADVEKTRADDPELHYRKARALQAAGETEAARSALERFQELQQAATKEETSAKRLGTEFNEALRLASENKLAEALAQVDAILAERPEHSRTLALRGKILFSMQRFDEALESLAEAGRLEPGRFEIAYLEGLFLLTMGRPVEAEGALVRAAALDANQPEAFQLLGQATARQEKYELAAAYFERALDLGRDTVTLRLNYANVLDILGRTEDFEAQMEAYRRLKAAAQPE